MADVHLLAVLRHARDIAARTLRFGPAGTEVVTGEGAILPLTVDGAPVVVQPREIEDGLAFLEWKDSSYGDMDLGAWNLTVADDGTVVAKMAKPLIRPCLEALISTEAEGLARLRSVYREAGIDVFIVSDGVKRARHLARTILAERNAVGLNTSLVSPEEMGHRITATVDRASGKGADWRILHGNKIAFVAAFRDTAPGDDVSRVFVLDSDALGHVARHFDRSRTAMDDHIEKRARPTLFVNVDIVSGKAQARMKFSKSLHDMTSPDHGFDDAPWDRHVARRDKLNANRVRAPRTWHSTTEDVARAFIAREAPRGFVGGKSLFFHGPVAYSIWQDTPIAAFVRLPDRDPVIFVGRETGIGGGKAGIQSMAQGDIERVTGDAFEIIRMDRLGEFLKIGDVAVTDFARKVERSKNEDDFPVECVIDPAGLDRWFKGEFRDATTELKEALKTRIPTFRKAFAYHHLANLSRKRDEFAEMLGIELPLIGDAMDFQREGEQAARDAEHRKTRLEVDRATRNAEKREEEAGREDGPGFPM